jgi:histidyl-tRNA synthetase
MNSSVQSIKRYHIAKVYRRDQPAMAKGRMREFYQCDFDIAGTYDPMLPDAEILRILCEVFGELGWGNRFTIKINHRGILDGIFEVCGVPTEKIRLISSAVDKLDKLPWGDVRKEMTEEKGLEGEVADRIWEFVQKKGGREILNELISDEKLKDNKSMTKGIDDMSLLFSYLDAFNVLDKLEFNLSLARGLDYYTGLIFEVVTDGSAPPSATAAAPTQKPSRAAKPPKTGDFDEDRSNDPSVGVGSLAGGGRYDELVGMFSGKAQVPCVGVSLGIERIFSITKARMQADQRLRTNEVDAYVMAFGGKGFTGLLKERLEICRTLWDAGIKVSFASLSVPSFFPTQANFPKLK